jgi:phosphatidylserine/phosphatidylglycerophosphate/cardiolipin synthase-like enzyme
MKKLGERRRAPRIDMNGEPLAVFYPPYFHWRNCRIGHLYLRKWRGNRGRIWIAMYRRGLI